MRIACLQFAPVVADTENNLSRAEAVLLKSNAQDLDLLVLPELAFSGYNFKSLNHISPFLEPTAAGVTSLWARTMALKYNCVVTAGYPERVDVTASWPASPEYYNSAITVNRAGETIANYRKSFLYYTDETWALEGRDGFYDGEIEDLGKNVAMGICMDINPYRFEAPWNAWEFAFHVLEKQANLVILSMAWLTREDARSYSRTPNDPDMETLSYWLARLEPLIRSENDGEIIVVFANRCGVEDDAIYAGTSAVLGIHLGEVKVYGILGRGEKELLVVDTSKPPMAKLIVEPPSASSNTTMDSHESSTTYRTTPDPDDLVLSIDEVLCGVIPVSPVEPQSPHSYFSSRHPKPEDVYDSLKSSSEHGVPTPPIDNRPSSPKSRNVSRTRQPALNDPALVSHDLANEPAIIRPPTVEAASRRPTPYVGDIDSGDSRLVENSALIPPTHAMSPRPRSLGW